MGTLKLNKLLLIAFSLILGFVLYNCNKMYEKQAAFETKVSDEIKDCINSPFIAQSTFKISFNEYEDNEIGDAKLIILRKGKIIKTYYRNDRIKKQISFDNEKIIRTDTLKVVLNNDIYYIHNFENDFWVGYKPHKCFLNSYKINNINCVEERGLNYGDKYSDSSPSVKEFNLKKEFLIR